MSYLKSILFLCLLSFSFISNAQTTEKTIYLKNGEILKGKILETDENYLKVEILGGSVFVVAQYNIIKIVEATQDNPKKNRRRLIPKAKRYHTLNTGMLLGVNLRNGILHGFSGQYILGYKVTDDFGLGLGLALDLQDEGNYYEVFLPVFIEGKGSLEKYFPSYFYSVQLGYSLGESLYFHPKIGYNFFSKQRFDFNVELGYVLQQVGYVGLKTLSNANPEIHRMYSYNRLVVRLSVTLNNTSKKSK